MVIEARRVSPFVGPLLSGSRAGCVQGVFSTSFNVEFDGRIVHVGRDSDLFSCTGLSITQDDMAALAPGLVAGNIATIRDGVLRLYATMGVVEVDVNGATVVPCAVPRVPDEKSAGWAASRLAGLPLRERTGLPSSQETRRALSALADSGSLPHAVEEAVAHLTGRGPGLTPSGDDVLLGYTCCRVAFGMGDGLADLVVRKATGATTPVSVSYAQALAEGFINPVYRKLLCAATDCNQFEFMEAVRMIERVGHTSGIDALLGLSLGFSYVCTRAASPIHEVA